METELCENWDEIRDMIKDQDISLGPYFGHQVRHSPRHLLFTLSRYKFAAKMLPPNKRLKVLEIGCSEGIGSVMLSEPGHYITATDIDSEAIECAKKNLERDNIQFLNKNILKTNKIGQFDFAVSLDVIEHIQPSEEDQFFNSIINNLTRKGGCIIGTPNETANQYASKASQLGHINLYTYDRLIESMQKYFEHVFCFGMNDEIVHTGFPAMCHYLMAIGCVPK